MYFIGDVHGHWWEYKGLVKRLQCSIQLGDMGLGFYPTDLKNFPDNPNHRFIRGNHDDPAICRKTNSYLGDYGYLDEMGGIYYISGGLSIDKARRIPGISWWPDEELSQPQLMTALKDVVRLRPRIILSHEAPAQIMPYIKEQKIKADRWFFGDIDKLTSQTSKALTMIFDEYKPEYWIFGHHHWSFRKEFQTTKFIGLAELEYVKITDKTECE